MDLREHYDVDTVVSAVVRGFNEERSARAEADVLGVYGLTREKFLADGFHRFGPEKFQKMCDMFESVILDVDFLVCGFDKVGNPHVSDVLAGTPHDHDPQGYWAIGSGSRIALAALAVRQQNPRLDIRATIFNLCEARFMAEMSYGVGRGETIVAVQRQGYAVQLLPDPTVYQLRMAWWFHSRFMPPQALAGIDTWLPTIGIAVPPPPGLPPPPPPPGPPPAFPIPKPFASQAEDSASSPSGEVSAQGDPNRDAD